MLVNQIVKRNGKQNGKIKLNRYIMYAGIIGGGISGLYCALELSKKHKVVLFDEVSLSNLCSFWGSYSYQLFQTVLSQLLIFGLRS